MKIQLIADLGPQNHYPKGKMKSRDFIELSLTFERKGEGFVKTQQHTWFLPLVFLRVQTELFSRVSETQLFSKTTSEALQNIKRKKEII